MPRRPTLQDFIDDELLRAPMTFDVVIDTVQQRWRLRLPQHSRLDGDPARALQLHRNELVSEALQTLRTAAQLDQAAGTGPGSTGPAAVPIPAAAELALIDEDDVAVDVEIARCNQTIRLTAEAELRELHTYTSALVEDVNVARDTNPFRPERFVRALWAGLQRVPLSRPVLVAFLHEAAVPLAEALRRAYGAASQRLQAQGIAPAAHRTIVFGGSGTAWGAEISRYRPPANLPQLADLPRLYSLHSLHDSMPSGLDSLDALSGLGASGPAATAPQQARPASGADPQLIELLARLFTAMQNDKTLGAPSVALLQRLQPTVLRVALQDASLLDSYDHPAWRFMDHLAFDIACCALAQQARLLGLCRNLVDHLAAQDAPDGSHFSWAIVRLAAARRHGLDQALHRAAPQIQRLQRIASDEASAATVSMALDIGTLDTVPADLLPEPDDPAAPLALHALTKTTTPGTVLRCHLQGEWRQLLWLWQDDAHELLLLGEPASGGHWALRQPALARLTAEGLAWPMRVRSLVRRAADKVLHAL